MKRDEQLITQHGTLRPTTTDDPIEGRLRVFCNRWGVASQRAAMLDELRKLLRYALTREEDDDDPMAGETPTSDDLTRKPDQSLF